MLLSILRQMPAANTRIQLVEEPIQSALSRLTRGHLSQEITHVRGCVGNSPANLSISDVGIASVVKLKSQRSISRRP